MGSELGRSHLDIAIAIGAIASASVQWSPSIAAF